MGITGATWDLCRVTVSLRVRSDDACNNLTQGTGKRRIGLVRSWFYGPSVIQLEASPGGDGGCDGGVERRAMHTSTEVDEEGLCAARSAETVRNRRGRPLHLPHSLTMRR